MFSSTSLRHSSHLRRILLFFFFFFRIGASPHRHRLRQHGCSRRQRPSCISACIVPFFLACSDVANTSERASESNRCLDIASSNSSDPALPWLTSLRCIVCPLAESDMSSECSVLISFEFELAIDHDHPPLLLSAPLQACVHIDQPARKLRSIRSEPKREFEFEWNELEHR